MAHHHPYNRNDLPQQAPQPEHSRSSSADLVFGSSSTGNEYNFLPSISEVIREVNKQRPRLGIRSLELDLSISGVKDSCQLLLMPEEVLSITGNIGLPQIRNIWNIARQIILPRLGFQGVYNEPELQDLEGADEEGHDSEEDNDGVMESKSEEQGESERNKDQMNWMQLTQQVVTHHVWSTKPCDENCFVEFTSILE